MRRSHNSSGTGTRSASILLQVLLRRPDAAHYLREGHALRHSFEHLLKQLASDFPGHRSAAFSGITELRASLGRFARRATACLRSASLVMA